MGAPVRLQKAVPRSKENASGAPKGAPVRVMDRQFPPAGGTGLAVRQANGCGDPRPRISALRYPLLEGRRVETDNLDGSPGGCAARQRSRTPQTNSQRKDDVEIAEPNINASKGREIASLRSQ